MGKGAIFVNFIKSVKSLTTAEKILWIVSVTVILLSLIVTGRFEMLVFTASVLGISSTLFAAKGDVFGPVLIIFFSILYAIISYQTNYYGEMITYLGMTTPMAIFSVVSWLKNPFQEGKNEVEISSLTVFQIVKMLIYSVAVTAAFYFILKYFHTASLIVSTISITTSFLAAYLTFCRSSFYALAYAANDLILIILWIIAAGNDSSYISMAVCFTMFFINDIYGFYSWSKMKKRQLALLQKNV